MRNEEKKNAEGAATPTAAVQNVQGQSSILSTGLQPSLRPTSQARYRSMANIVARPIEWLWHGVFAVGKFSLICGNPGLGKSQVSLDVAAIVSNPRHWPASSTISMGGKVIILSAEDDAADTIKPRLEAAGADMDKVFILDAVHDENGRNDRMFNLKSDLDKLAALINEIGEVSLIIIDPVSAYFGGVDSHKDADLRQLLSPLSKFAEKYKVAIIGIAHLNKGGDGKAAITRTSGSIGLVGAARSAWYVIKDEVDPDLRLFASAKNNLGKDGMGYAFRVISQVVQNGIETSRVDWESKTFPINLDALMSTPTTSVPSALDDAEDFLKQLLANHFYPSNNVFAEAKKAGISRASVNRAKERLGIKPFKQSSGEWAWKLPNEERNATCSVPDDEQHEYLD